MKLFVARITGSYALEVKIIRAADKEAAKTIVLLNYDEDIFDTTDIEVEELDPTGETGVVFEASYIE